MPISWSICFDWDNDETYAYNEEARVLSLSIERGRPDQFSPFAAGKAVLSLENQDRRFDPWYASSPLYGRVMPGRRVRIEANVGADLVLTSASDILAASSADTIAWQSYPVFIGRIEDIEPTGDIGKRRVSITAYDDLRVLGQVDTPTALRTNLLTYSAIFYILAEAGWTAAKENLGTGGDSISYWWTPGGEVAKKLIDDLVLSEGGAFFISRSGIATHYDRAALLTLTTAGSLDEANVADLRLVNPWEVIYNIIKIRCRPVVLAATAEIWKLEETGVFLAQGGSLEIWAEYHDANGAPCAAQSVVTPAAVTDYAAWTSIDGLSGSNMTASLSITVNKYSTWAKLTLTNVHPTAVGLYVTLLRLRGDALSQTPTTIRKEDPTSQAAYGKHALSIDTLWKQSVIDATDMATSLINFYATPHASLTAVLDNLFPDLLAYELLDKLTVTIGSYSINSTFRLGALRLWTGQTMQDLKGEFSLEACDTTVYWFVGVAGNSEVGMTTRLGY